MPEVGFSGGTGNTMFITQPASYIIYIDGSTIKAVNGTTGVVDYSGADAATVIQNAINALTNGGIIHIKNGTYTINSTIQLTNNIFIEGEDMYETVLQAGINSNIYVISTVNGYAGTGVNNFCELSNFRIYGNSSNNTTGNGIQWSVFSGKINRVMVEYCNVNGILVQGYGSDNAVDNVIFDCIVRFNTEGIKCYSRGGDCLITNNHVYHNSDCGIWQQTGDVRINHNNIYDNMIGVYVAQQSWGSIIGNHLEANTQQQIYIVSGASLSVRDIVIIGNNIYNGGTDSSNAYDAIYINGRSGGYDAIGILIIGNTIEGTDQRYGINLNSYTLNCIATGNTFYGSFATAAMINSGTGNIVKNNSGFVTENSGATSVANGGTITHGLVAAPTKVRCTPSVSGEMVSVTALGAMTFTVAIIKNDGSAGTTQTIYWEAEV